MKFGKMEIANCLSAVHNYKSFLEISTPTTGNQYSGVNAKLFSVINRLSYNVPENFDDGLRSDFTSTNLDIDLCVSEILMQKLNYDIVFLDPYHDLASSQRD